MIILDTTVKKIEILLAGAVAANQLPVTTHFVDVAEPDYYRPNSYDTASNSTTAVPIVYAPGTDVRRQVKLITIYNADTAQATVTVRLVNNATNRIIVKIDLQPASTLIYTDGEGFRVIDTLGQIQ